MKIVKLSFFALLLYYSGIAQVISDFSSLKTYPVKTLNWKHFNWQELKPFVSLINTHNIVVLSDGTHFEGGIKDAQCMILKGLIDSNLINTIYIEASWIDINRVQSILKTKGRSGIQETTKYFNLGLEYWMDTGFLTYLADQIQNGKVRLVGFDIANTSSSSSYQMFKQAYELPVIRQMAKNTSSEFKFLRNQYLLFNFENLRTIFSKYNLELHETFIRTVKNEYLKRKDIVGCKEWERMLNYFEWIYKRQFFLQDISNARRELDADLIKSSKYHAYRDSMMSKILAEDYRLTGNVKAVAIMGGYHSLSNFIESEDIQKYIVASGVGTVLDLLGKELDSIATIEFISGSGSYGIYNDGKKQFEHRVKVFKHSIEQYYQKDQRDFFYIDLQDYPSSKSFYSGLFFKRPIRALWAKMYHGFFYIKEAHPLQLKIRPSIVMEIDDTVERDINEGRK